MCVNIDKRDRSECKPTLADNTMREDRKCPCRREFGGCYCVVIYKSIILEPPEENAKTGPPLVSEKQSRRGRGFEPEQYCRLRSRRLLGLVLVFLFFFSFWSFILGLDFSFLSPFLPLPVSCLLTRNPSSTPRPSRKLPSLLWFRTSRPLLRSRRRETRPLLSMSGRLLWIFTPRRLKSTTRSRHSSAIAPRYVPACMQMDGIRKERKLKLTITGYYLLISWIS